MTCCLVSEDKKCNRNPNVLSKQGICVHSLIVWCKFYIKTVLKYICLTKIEKKDIISSNFDFSVHCELNI